MTLAEATKTKYLTLEGTFTNVDDLREFWFLAYPLGDLSLSGVEQEYKVKFKGEFYKGLYVLGVLIDAVRKANANCHLEISATYEDARIAERG